MADMSTKILMSEWRKIDSHEFTEAQDAQLKHEQR